MRGFFLAVLLIVLAYVLGFVAFVSLLPRFPADLRGADGVVVLTGGETRLDRAVALFEHGVGKRLLISGVDVATTKETLKHRGRMAARVSIAAPIWAMRPKTRTATPLETADWARAHHFHHLIVVTARYHMPRAHAGILQRDAGCALDALSGGTGQYRSCPTGGSIRRPFCCCIANSRNIWPAWRHHRWPVK